MADTAFLAMRADLIARGLLTPEHRLTDAGHAHVDALIERLLDEEAPCDPTRPRVRWNRRRGRSARA
ncbi:MAG: hypothetical protein J0I69_02925 [Altererythrobacter sp.]|nr:hypothetical protein [Altererythrobacter sp.]OJU60965.1 MAG: hypothetical protein BGO08_12640 [Altererythrobacter sp. 66-12]